MKITMAHGSGGKETNDLICEVFAENFKNQALDTTEDCAVVYSKEKIAVTTDSFVITPLVYPGGDIGRLSVCGTVNDLLMRGAMPKYITSAFIIEEGADIDMLKKTAASMAQTADEAGVKIICGDTKVTNGNGGIYINTAGIGFVNTSLDISAANIVPGDAVVVSGNLGDHHAAILSARMQIENNIKSDNAPLGEMVKNMLKSGIEIHTMRDITRGGLGTVLNELAAASHTKIEIEEEKIPCSPAVKAFSKMLGTDILHMGNEGKLVAFMPRCQAEEAVKIIRASKYGADAAIIGEAKPLSSKSESAVTIVTSIGGRRVVTPLFGEGLPRIC